MQTFRFYIAHANISVIYLEKNKKNKNRPWTDLRCGYQTQSSPRIKKSMLQIMAACVIWRLFTRHALRGVTVCCVPRVISAGRAGHGISTRETSGKKIKGVSGWWSSSKVASLLFCNLTKSHRQLGKPCRISPPDAEAAATCVKAFRPIIQSKLESYSIYWTHRSNFP